MTSTRDRIAAHLRDVLTDAAHPGVRLAENDLVAAGVPRRWAPALSRRTLHVSTVADVDDLAHEYADLLAADLEASQ